MKQFIALLCITIGLMSCTEHDSNNKNEYISKETQILLRFKTQSLLVQIRGDFDSSEAKPWETEINTLDLYVFEGVGERNLISSYALSKDEALSGEVMIGIPEEYIGEDIKLCAIANHKITNPSTTYFQFLKTASMGPASYNGEYEKVKNGLIPQSGFEMSGEVNIKQPEIGMLTPVTIELERIVNKTAIQTKVADNFKELYKGGDIRVQQICANTATRSSILKEPNPPSNSITLEQTSHYENGYYNNLFYFFERNQESSFTVECLFDKDGDFSTLNDQEIITFIFKAPIGLIGDGNSRNVYYRISITINALPDSINPGFTIDEYWNDSIDQDFDFNFQNPV